MRIGTCEAARGQLTRGELPLPGNGAAPTRIPVAIAQGERDGPTIFVSAGVHGDELNGIVTVQRFLQTLDVSGLQGTIIVLPVVNPGGLAAGRREVPGDERDLNRCFPGDPDGSSSERMAHVLFSEVIARCDAGVDVHDSGRASVLLPHPRAHILSQAGTYDPSQMEPIAAFGTDTIMLCRGMDGVLTVEASRRFGIPAFTAEIGGAMILWRDFIERALIGLRNVLVYHGMLDGPMVLPHRQLIIPGEDDIAMPAPIDGILFRHASLGKAVYRDELLAEIRNPLTGEHRNLRARQCGVVHDLNVHATVNAGDDVVGVLEFDSCPSQGQLPTGAHVNTIYNKASGRVQLRASELFNEALALQL